jgi:hypothetical protein
MTDSRPPLAAFDDGILESVADGTGLTAGQLRELARRHQDGVRDLPGVDNIVYEWRNHFHMDPLVGRTDAVYVLALRDHVWEEFADRMDISAEERAALEEVHDRQARELVAATDRLDSDPALVLTRP